MSKNVTSCFEKSKVEGEQEVLLAFRSSSTLEDLNNMAGAGLFDSILNVKAEAMESVKKAICAVWSSLFTQRAIISRKQMKISSI